MKLLVIAILHIFIFPSCNGNAVELSCVICESSPEKIDQNCVDGRGISPVLCAAYYAKINPSRRRKSFVCAFRITQKASVYGLYYKRTCVMDREALPFCLNNEPDEQRFRHCSTCTGEACNKAPKAMSTMITAVSTIIVLMIT